MRILLLLAVAAAPACRNDCSPNAEPRLTLGTGEDGYYALDPVDPTYELIHGLQGGWHLPIAIDAAGLNATDIVVVSYQGRIDGEVVARNDENWNTFTCNTETKTLQAWNTYLIFDAESNCPLDGAEIEVSASTLDAKGNPISASVVATVDDPLHDETCGA